MILGSTRGLMTVLSDLLDYLKNEARGVNVVLQPIAPRQLVRALHSEFELEALDKGIELSVVEDPTLPDWIEGDPARIQQVLTNLLGNAIKYASGGHVRVSVTVVDERIRYEVEDQGPGITKVDLEQLFKLFARVGPERDRSTGLGLAISKQLVIAMGGDIGVRSEPGRGSRFWFDLPLKRCAPPDEPSSRSIAAQRPSQGRLRVGIIDDDPLNLYVAEEFLRRLGHDVVVFQDSEAIERQIEARALDALLLDVMMPGESGTEIAARLRASGRGRAQSIVIVAVTGNVLPENLQHFLDAGFDAVLQKPIFIDQLGRVLQKAMSSRSRVVRTGTPAVAAPGVDGSAEALGGDNRQGTLRRLRADIGDARYLQSVRAAEKVFRALLAGLEGRLSLASLMPMLHRVRGSAPQLGLVRLGELAGALEDRGQSDWADGAKPMSSVASDASELGNALRDALVVLEGEI
jgi:CheY-like chemotaxis protein/anti-sigma regulatory factor (Ser/Thr protein kinase)/HPt (histidine-containing phosphotransfer) domain-containing protein